MSRIADDIRKLGFPGAAAIMAERLPRGVRARSGDLGEILATEIVEEQLGFEVPIRRLRYKDDREMPLRGDDFIGVKRGPNDELLLLKGESKSQARLVPATIRNARAALSRDDGRPTATSLLFVADRLMEGEGAAEELGKAIRDEIAMRAFPAERIGHALFTMSGNPAPAALAADLAAAGPERTHAVIHLHIEDHQDFIRTSYEEALIFGNG